MCIQYTYSLLMKLHLLGLDWRSLPRGSVIVDVGGGIGSTSMLLANAFARPGDDQDLGFKFIVQDRPIVVELGEKVSYFVSRNA